MSGAQATYKSKHYLDGSVVILHIFFISSWFHVESEKNGHVDPEVITFTTNKRPWV
jgi:hypothetical protein